MSTKKSDGLSDAERRAIKERSAEVKASKGGRSAGKAERERQDVIDALAAMPDADREIARALHDVIVEAVPDLSPRLWYSQPAYAMGGKVVCFVRGAAKDEVRYVTLGFSDAAALGDGTFWPTSYAVTGVDEEVAATVARLVRRATSATSTDAAAPATT